MDESILSSLRNEFLSRSPVDTLPDAIWRRTAALNTWGTNAIEGNTLTWADVQKLLMEQRSVPNRSVTEILETIQHESAFRGLLLRRAGPIRTLTAMELHEAVFRGIKADAGQWRRVNVRITGSKHTPPRMEKVIDLMEGWEKAYFKRDMAGEPVFSLGAWMHHRFEWIHPFSDGNGRVGRLLLNLHFLRQSWPPVHVLPPDREAYLGCLGSGNEGNLWPLDGFLRVTMARSLLDLLDQLGTALDDLRPLKVLESRGPYSAKYLALRASQGQLPALKVSGDWHTSKRALGLYMKRTGRG